MEAKAAENNPYPSGENFLARKTCKTNAKKAPNIVPNQTVDTD